MNGTPAVYNTVVKDTTAGYASIDGFISDTANYTPTQEPLLTNPTLQVGGQPVDSAIFYSVQPDVRRAQLRHGDVQHAGGRRVPVEQEVPHRHLA